MLTRNLLRRHQLLYLIMLPLMVILRQDYLVMLPLGQQSNHGDPNAAVTVGPTDPEAMAAVSSKSQQRGQALLKERSG